MNGVNGVIIPNPYVMLPKTTDKFAPTGEANQPLPENSVILYQPVYDTARGVIIVTGKAAAGVTQVALGLSDNKNTEDTSDDSVGGVVVDVKPDGTFSAELPMPTGKSYLAVETYRLENGQFVKNANFSFCQEMPAPVTGPEPKPLPPSDTLPHITDSDRKILNKYFEKNSEIDQDCLDWMNRLTKEDVTSGRVTRENYDLYKKVVEIIKNLGGLAGLSDFGLTSKNEAGLPVLTEENIGKIMDGDKTVAGHKAADPTGPENADGSKTGTSTLPSAVTQDNYLALGVVNNSPFASNEKLFEAVDKFGDPKRAGYGDGTITWTELQAYITNYNEQPENADKKISLKITKEAFDTLFGSDGLQKDGGEIAKVFGWVKNFATIKYADQPDYLTKGLNEYFSSKKFIWVKDTKELREKIVGQSGPFAGLKSGSIKLQKVKQPDGTFKYFVVITIPASGTEPAKEELKPIEEYFTDWKFIKEHPSWLFNAASLDTTSGTDTETTADLTASEFEEFLKVALWQGYQDDKLTKATLEANKPDDLLKFLESNETVKDAKTDQTEQNKDENPKSSQLYPSIIDKLTKLAVSFDKTVYDELFVNNAEGYTKPALEIYALLNNVNPDYQKATSWEQMDKNSNTLSLKPVDKPEDVKDALAVFTASYNEITKLIDLLNKTLAKVDESDLTPEQKSTIKAQIITLRKQLEERQNKITSYLETLAPKVIDPIFAETNQAKTLDDKIKEAKEIAGSNPVVQKYLVQKLLSLAFPDDKTVPADRDAILDKAAQLAAEFGQQELFLSLLAKNISKVKDEAAKTALKNRATTYIDEQSKNPDGSRDAEKCKKLATAYLTAYRQAGNKDWEAVLKEFNEKFKFDPALTKDDLKPATPAKSAKTDKTPPNTGPVADAGKDKPTVKSVEAMIDDKKRPTDISAAYMQLTEIERKTVLEYAKVKNAERYDILILAWKPPVETTTPNQTAPAIADTANADSSQTAGGFQQK